MSSQPNQSLIDGIRCFQELTTSPVPLGNKELAGRLGINVMRANRLLRTLKSIGMAEQNAQKKYMPGPVVHVLAAQSFHSSPLMRAATRIAVDTSYVDRTLAIGILWRGSVVYMYHAQAHQAPAEGLGGFHLLDVRNSAIGQVLMAGVDDAALADCTAEWEADERSAMAARIADVRQKGYLCNRDADGAVATVACAFSVEGATAGIAFTDFRDHSSDERSRVGELRALIARIEQLSGESVEIPDSRGADHVDQQ